MRKHTCQYGRKCFCDNLPRAGGAQLKVKAQWPRVSDALGVHPSQIPEAIDEARRLGVSISYTKDGSAEVQSLQHQNELLKAYNMVDLSGNGTRDGLKTHQGRVYSR